MAGLRDKLKTMASLSEDWNAQAAAPEAPKTGGLGDDVFFYPLDHKTGDYTLKEFLSIDEESFFGLNDEAAMDLDPRRVLFLDTETTGLFGANVQAFLVGLGYYTNSGFCVRQLLMRNLASEEALLQKLDEIFQNFDVIVTFNGKSYDIPLIQTRMLYCRMHGSVPDTHIDLIHPARRIYKLRIESCRLSNIEDKIFHAGRSDDIDGAEIPGRYFRYIRTGDESLLSDILEHNRQDIVSMRTGRPVHERIRRRPLQHRSLLPAAEQPPNGGKVFFLRHRWALVTAFHVAKVPSFKKERHGSRRCLLGRNTLPHARLLPCADGTLQISRTHHA